MKYFAVTYYIDQWHTLPLRLWAKDEKEAMRLGKEKLIEKGHLKTEFESLIRLGKRK